jgi:hypothetical protein
VLFHLPPSHLFSFFSFVTACLTILRLAFVQGHQSFLSRPPLPEGGPIQADPISAAFEAPEAEESKDGDDAKDSLEGTSLTMSPPPAHSEDLSLDRKRKRAKELLSSSTSASKAAVGEPSAPNDEIEIFDLLDSSVLADFFSFIHFLSFDLCKVFAFCFLCSDNENPKRDTATASAVDIPASDEPPSQEAGVMVQSPEAPIKKGNPRASKRLKKAAVASTFLDTHRPIISVDDVSTASYSLFVYCLNFSSHVFLFTYFDEEICLFGH